MTERDKSEGYIVAGRPVLYKNEYGLEVDLGFAANPSGAAFEAERLASMTSTQQIREYDSDVMHSDVKKLLVSGIGLNKGVEDDSVLLHPNGSYGAGDEVIRAAVRHFATEGHKPIVYVSSYSFPNVNQYTARHGATYQPLPSGETLFQSDSLKNVFKMGTRELENNIVYVDYPNNPTGIANSDLLRKTIDHVRQNKGIPFIDLAFGEVLGDEFRSAIQYSVDHGGVCVGSLTKTQGLAALRAGYIILSQELTQKFYPDGGGQKLVFGLPAHVKNAYSILFTKGLSGRTEAQNQASKAIKYNQATNSEFHRVLHDQGLSLAPTIEETPIQVVYNKAGGNLHARLDFAGVNTESLSDYKTTLVNPEVGLKDSAVRVLTPRVGALKETIKRVAIAMKFSEDFVSSKVEEKHKFDKEQKNLKK